jgi:hypothetical protein
LPNDNDCARFTRAFESTTRSEVKSGKENERETSRVRGEQLTVFMAHELSHLIARVLYGGPLESTNNRARPAVAAMQFVIS